MSAIANFKKRREAAKAQQSPTANETTATPAPENEALHLLAALLGCDVEEALEKAREAVEQKARFIKFKIGFDPAKDADETAIANVTTDDQGNITSIIDHDAELEDSAATVTDAAETALDAADKVSESADKVSSAAGDLESAATNLENAAGAVDDSASSLAYTTDDLGQVAAELKEATAELKKPSAAQESSRGAKAAAPKSNSKK
ncbi:hypothetical protein [Shewanella baltica]|uniref:hypothetical protein n=1 Tax=Shewanella baltica TaxID=62322 RepID=UPI00217D682D|nr:hypothetical protein [Shewanella baltica]MCS6178948.1 hypothetical protein [Shewanella baltica]MCS6255112.1 hypothetical protein [Shewanella baltica]